MPGAYTVRLSVTVQVLEPMEISDDGLQLTDETASLLMTVNVTCAEVPLIAAVTTAD